MEITRSFEFDSGHRVLGHGSKCRFLHGHRYRAEVSVVSDGLDELGMVMDFGKVKELVGNWIDENLDHNMILHEDDYLAHSPHSQLVGRQPYIMPTGENPTAENIAKLIYDRTSPLIRDHGLVMSRVRVWETPNCWADYEPT